MPETRLFTPCGARALQGAGSRPRRAAATPRGFTVIEVLIASVLLLIITVGILPMFIRGVVSNAEGLDHSRVANFARGRGEEFFQLPFDSPDLEVQAGTERVFDEHYSHNKEAWADGATAEDGDTALWTRTTTIRQFGVDDLTAPLDDTAPSINVHLKEITVTVQSNRAGPLGVGKGITVRLFKSQ